MNIILTCIGNFQEYIIDNIKQLIKLGNENIYIIANIEFKSYFQDFIDNCQIEFIPLESLNDSFRFLSNTGLDKDFRNGFWAFTSARFFYIYEFMKMSNIENVIHIENDVLLYYNCDILKDKFTDHIYLPFDTFTRNIASIMYIPNHLIFGEVLALYDFNNTDMANFANIRIKSGLIKNFPICITNNMNTEFEFVTQNFDIFQFIFDAAGIGQYIGGVDPKNISGDTRGFINETCIIKYNEYEIEWKWIEESKKPFLNGYPIFNLHIHCKNLKLYA
jgi:hypothetical protein